MLCQGDSRNYPSPSLKEGSRAMPGGDALGAGHGRSSRRSLADIDANDRHQFPKAARCFRVLRLDPLLLCSQRNSAPRHNLRGLLTTFVAIIQ